MKTVDELLSLRQFAAEIRKGPRAVLRMITAGEIAAEDHRSPGSSRPRYRIPRGELMRWRQSRRVGAPSRRPLAGSTTVDDLFV